MYSYIRLKKRITTLYGDLEAFAKAVKQKPTSIRDKLNNAADFSREDIVSWGEALLIEPELIGKYFFTDAIS